MDNRRGFFLLVSLKHFWWKSRTLTVLGKSQKPSVKVWKHIITIHIKWIDIIQRRHHIATGFYRLRSLLFFRRFDCNECNITAQNDKLKTAIRIWIDLQLIYYLLRIRDCDFAASAMLFMTMRIKYEREKLTSVWLSDNNGRNGTEELLDSLTNGLIKMRTEYGKGKAWKICAPMVEPLTMTIVKKNWMNDLSKAI